MTFEQTLLRNWSNTKYQHATGDINFERVPQRVRDLWYGPNGILNVDRRVFTHMDNYRNNHPEFLNPEMYIYVVEEKQKYTESLYKEILQNFENNGWNE